MTSHSSAVSATSWQAFRYLTGQRFLLGALLIAFGLQFLNVANAALTVVPVNDIEVSLVNELGGDYFGFSPGNGFTAYFFGNRFNSSNLDTADRVPLDMVDEQQYFQSATILPAILGPPEGSTRAYWFDSAPSGGATDGTNFSIYDANQDGTPDTLFRLEFGPDISERSDDFIHSYAYDLAGAGIDVEAARTALLVPEPNMVALLGLGATMLLTMSRRMRSVAA